MKITELTFVGHSAVFFKADNGTVLAIDPWLEQNPQCPEKLKQPEALDIIVLSHGHGDHAGDVVRLAKHYGSTVVATYELAMLIGKEGVSDRQLVPMNKGGTVEIKGYTISLTNAFHSSSFDTSSGTVYAGEPCGVVIRDGKTSVYHTGDTCLFSDISLIGEIYKPDVSLVCAGDRFTMGPREAARAARLSGCKVAIPIHYKTFDMLTGTAEDFQKYAAEEGVKSQILEPGQTFKF